MRTIVIIFPFLFAFASNAQVNNDPQLLLHLMQQSPSMFRYVLDHKKQLEVQIIYTQIDRDTNNRPTFKSFLFNVDSTKYFYPASTIKLPMVLLALDKLKRLKINGLNKFTTVLHDSVYAGQRNIHADPTSQNGLPSVAQYVRKILIVSDNDAYNALYELMGQQEANSKMKEKGYNIRITSRLARQASSDENRHTEALRFVKNDTLLYKQWSQVNEDSIRALRTVLKGKGFISNGHLIRKPFDFTYKNSFPLEDQQEILKAIIFPDAIAPEKRFNLTDDDRQFVLQYMSQLPRETLYPEYYKDTSLYDAIVKPLMFGDSRVQIPSNIRIFNKVGVAYGYLIDNAYIVDFDKNIEFMLSVVINVNLDRIYNDDKYEYKKVGYPFLKNLGQLIYRYELKRVRRLEPDLVEFKLKYDKSQF
ncbi:hypothetical protein BH10BAC4_BH10BAC4_24080 [soil metagenome]